MQKLFHPHSPLFFLVAMLVAGACSPILKQEYNQDQFLRFETIETGPSGVPDVSYTWSFEGEDLVVSVDRWRTCKRTQTKVMDRTAVTERRLKDNNTWVYAVLGGVAAGVGAVGVAMPGALVDKEAEKPKEEETKILLGGAGLLAAGTVFLGIAVVDWVRAVDTKKHIGEVRVPAGSGIPFACEEDLGAGLYASLEAPVGGVVRTKAIGADGTVRFSMTGLSEEIRAGRTMAKLQVGKRTQHISLLLCSACRETFSKSLEVQP